jgi:c-di-GMP phosphodiesterase
MSVLQKKLNEIGEGVLFIVKLLNKYELKILLGNTEITMNRYYDIINRICSNFNNCFIQKNSDLTTLYVILGNRTEISEEKLAYAIYSQVQLYIDPDYPESYLKCAVGSIKFSYKNQVIAEDLASKVLYGISKLKEGIYYYNHDDCPIDINSLREHNVNLNLLRSSLLKKKAKFAYQPVIGRESGNVEYYECLLRIKDEDDKFISVGSMIQDAEAKGLINIVDFTVTEMAIGELVKDTKTRLSVNISNIGVLNKRLLKRIEYLLKKFNVAERLIIEITETSLNSDFSTTKHFMDTLHSYGCKFALDDFGSGFTSFKQLLNLPIDIIKIDGSYVRDILNNNHSKFFVEALINLAEDLGIKTVAEFVENGEIAKYLIDLKIGGMQGNFFLPACENRLR